MKLYLFLISLFNTVFGYKPVVIVHGVMSEASNLDDLKENIEIAHPNTTVTLLHLYPDIASFTPLQNQIGHWIAKIAPIMRDSPDGIHLVCHSQGGLICQDIIEQFDEHNVDTFVALSSPLMGQFGVPSLFTKYLPWLKKESKKLSSYMYNPFAQDTISISNYWRDPRKDYQKSYLEESKYLPIVQNDPNSPYVTEEDAMKRKKNFLKLNKLVLIGGPSDGVITPWQSSVFGFYDENFNVVGMKNQTIFTEDWFGLRTLYERGDVIFNSIFNVKHTDWHGNKKVFEGYIEPFLT